MNWAPSQPYPHSPSPRCHNGLGSRSTPNLTYPPPPSPQHYPSPLPLPQHQIDRRRHVVLLATPRGPGSPAYASMAVAVTASSDRQTDWGLEEQQATESRPTGTSSNGNDFPQARMPAGQRSRRWTPWWTPLGPSPLETRSGRTSGTGTWGEVCKAKQVRRERMEHVTAMSRKWPCCVITWPRYVMTGARDRGTCEVVWSVLYFPTSTGRPLFKTFKPFHVYKNHIHPGI